MGAFPETRAPVTEAAGLLRPASAVLDSASGVSRMTAPAAALPGYRVQISSTGFPARRRRGTGERT